MKALASGVHALALLDGCGLAPILTMTGMIANRVDSVSRLPEGLDLRFR